MFGEGFGLLLSGSATALTGAPGSVLMYGLIGLMAWPRRRATADGRDHEIDQVVGVASSAAAQGIGGPITPLAVWSGFWALAAVLFLQPDNRTQTSISSAITGMASGEPKGYGHFLNTFGNHFGSVGTGGAWLLAIASLAIGVGPLVSRRPGPFLLAGGVLSALFWVTGQGLGGILTGSGTDPNTGPLIVLLALSMVPTRVAEPSTSRTPLASLLRRIPAVGAGCWRRAGAGARAQRCVPGPGAARRRAWPCRACRHVGHDAGERHGQSRRRAPPATRGRPGPAWT